MLDLGISAHETVCSYHYFFLQFKTQRRTSVFPSTTTGLSKLQNHEGGVNMLGWTNFWINATSEKDH